MRTIDDLKMERKDFSYTINFSGTRIYYKTYLVAGLSTTCDVEKEIQNIINKKDMALHTVYLFEELIERGDI